MSSTAVAVPPKAKANTKKSAVASGAKKPKVHPTYHEMVTEAIAALKERTGSSQIAIAKFIEEKQKPNLPGNFKKLLLVQLKKLVANGKLVKVKNSFKLPPKGSAATDGATATIKKAAPAKKASATKKAAPVKKASPSKKAAPVKKADDKVKSTPAKRKVVGKPKPNKVAKTVAVLSPAKKAVVPAKKKTPVKKVVKKPKTIKSPVKKKAASKKK